jgi:hypothetical protein
MSLSAEGSNSDAVEGMQPRRVEGKGEWIYDQYSDGTIVIVSHQGAMKNVTCAPGTPANTAITEEIGEYVAPETSSAGDGEQAVTPPTGDPNTDDGILAALWETGGDVMDAVGDLFGDVGDVLQETIIDVPLDFWNSLWADDEDSAQDTDETSIGEEAPVESTEDEVGQFFIVTDADARIRSEPPELKSSGNKIPLDTQVVVLESATKGDHQYSKVQDFTPDSETGEATLWGWTSHGNLMDGKYQKRVEEVASAEGASSNTAALKKSRETGNAFSPREVRSDFNGLEGQEFVDAVDAEVGPDGNKDWNEDQQALIQAAKEFAVSPKPLSAAQQANATIAWSNLTFDGTSLNGNLKSRMERFQQFIAWADLVTGPTKRASAMRSPKKAHELSTAWMYNTGNNTDSSGLSKANNRKKLADNLIEQNGVDNDGSTWASASTVQALQAANGDDDQIKALLPTMRADAAKVKTQAAVAAEGYTDPDWRKPNVKPGTYVSNHLKGLAVDAFPLWIFPNLFDPVIDAIALYFGIYRACKDLSTPEHWHYELLGSPPSSPEGESEASFG